MCICDDCRWNNYVDYNENLKAFTVECLKEDKLSDEECEGFIEDTLKHCSQFKKIIRIK